MQTFEIIYPEIIKYPIVLSLPHIGTVFPTMIAEQIKAELLPPDDTDWYLEKLYSFATTMGIPVLKSVYSRWVIDLNRNPDSKPLYNDGRIITNACTTTNFIGDHIYKNARTVIAEEDIAKRKQLYFDPYHETLQKLLDEVKGIFGIVLLWDGHSIRRRVSTISATAFPDFIIGTNDGASVPDTLATIVSQQLKKSFASVTLNHPFKGGYITRSYGQPQFNQHAIQLEMSKDLYMSDDETTYDETKSAIVQDALKSIFLNLGNVLLKKY